jgi:hypothetical protein
VSSVERSEGSRGERGGETHSAPHSGGVAATAATAAQQPRRLGQPLARASRPARAPGTRRSGRRPRPSPCPPRQVSLSSPLGKSPARPGPARWPVCPPPALGPRSAPPRRDSSTDPTVLVLPLASFESSCGSRPSRQPLLIPPRRESHSFYPARLFGMSIAHLGTARLPARPARRNPVRSSSFLYSLYINRLVHTGGHLVRQRRYGQSTDRIVRRLRNDLC